MPTVSVQWTHPIAEGKDGILTSSMHDGTRPAKPEALSGAEYSATSRPKNKQYLIDDPAAGGFILSKSPTDADNPGVKLSWAGEPHAEAILYEGELTHHEKEIHGTTCIQVPKIAVAKVTSKGKIRCVTVIPVHLGNMKKTDNSVIRMDGKYYYYTTNKNKLTELPADQVSVCDLIFESLGNDSTPVSLYEGQIAKGHRHLKTKLVLLPVELYLIRLLQLDLPEDVFKREWYHTLARANSLFKIYKLECGIDVIFSTANIDRDEGEISDLLHKNIYCLRGESANWDYLAGEAWGRKQKLTSEFFDRYLELQLEKYSIPSQILNELKKHIHIEESYVDSKKTLSLSSKDLYHTLWRLYLTGNIVNKNRKLVLPESEKLSMDKTFQLLEDCLKPLSQNKSRTVYLKKCIQEAKDNGNFSDLRALIQETKKIRCYDEAEGDLGKIEVEQLNLIKIELMEGGEFSELKDSDVLLAFLVKRILARSPSPQPRPLHYSKQPPSPPPGEMTSSGKVNHPDDTPKNSVLGRFWFTKTIFSQTPIPDIKTEPSTSDVTTGYGG